MEAFDDLAAFSVFVGDLAPDVNDFLLQESFRQFYPTVRSAKVRAVRWRARATAFTAHRMLRRFVAGWWPRPLAVAASRRLRRI
jgi:hypothetical protein